MTLDMTSFGRLIASARKGKEMGQKELAAQVIKAMRRRLPRWSPMMPNRTDALTAVREAKTKISENWGLLTPTRSIAISDW